MAVLATQIYIGGFDQLKIQIWRPGGLIFR